MPAIVTINKEKYTPMSRPSIPILKTTTNKSEKLKSIRPWIRHNKKNLSGRCWLLNKVSSTAPTTLSKAKTGSIRI